MLSRDLPGRSSIWRWHILELLCSWSMSLKLRFERSVSCWSVMLCSSLRTNCGYLYVILSWSVKIKGDSMVLASNRSGWLHTFLSCIRTLMMLKKSVSAKIFLVLSVLMYSSYSSRCLLDRLHETICSIFSGSYFSTSFFILRSRNGLRIDCSFCTTLKFKLLFWLIELEKGFENHSLKSCWFEKMLGIKKCIRDHSSITSFWSGVPVRRSLLLVLNLSNVCHLWLLKFFMFWASSSTM